MPLSLQHQALANELEALAAKGHRPASMRQAAQRLRDAQAAMDTADPTTAELAAATDHFVVIVQQTARLLERERR